MSFHSDPEMRDDLRKPFPPQQISKLPGTAKRPALDYVSHAAVTDRLNHAAPDWTYSLAPVVTEKDGMPHVVAVFGHMTIGGVSRPEVGAVDSPSSYGQELKEAISDFIRRGAMRFGVALDLWAKEDLATPTAQSPPRAAGQDTGSATPSSDTVSPSVEARAGEGSPPNDPARSKPGTEIRHGDTRAASEVGALSPAAPGASTSTSVGEDKNQGTVPAETSGEEGKATGEGVNPSSSGLLAEAVELYGSKPRVLSAARMLHDWRSVDEVDEADLRELIDKRKALAS